MRVTTPGKKACIPIYTFEQLEQYPLQTLKLKARNLVETIGAEALPSLAGIATQEKLINYILDVQISMCATGKPGPCSFYFFDLPMCLPCCLVDLAVSTAAQQKRASCS